MEEGKQSSEMQKSEILSVHSQFSFENENILPIQ